MPHSLTPSQQDAFERIKAFLDNNSDIFVLKGYAGTGKTYLIKHITDYLNSIKRAYELLAPTGRAAKVLRDMMNRGMTIHKCIYSRELITINDDNADGSTKSYKFIFPIVETPQDYQILIIDESSMISNVENHSEFLCFGSGVLLDDLLHFARVCGIKKVIFVGDPAQLPPVMDPHSCALDVEYLAGRGLEVENFELTEVVRQKDNNAIFTEATKIRQLLKQPKQTRHNFSIESDGKDIFELQANELSERFTDMFPIPDTGNGIAVCFTNSQCFEVNRAIRTILFPGADYIQVGDLVIINNNNYTSYGITLFNGDMAKVVGVGEVEYHRNIPVTIKNEKRHITLVFRDIDLFFAKEGTTIRCKIFDDLLHSGEPELSVWQMRAVYIDFILRNQSLKNGTPEFREALTHDPFFNAMKVKFGYAVTCHKAQGGEWDTVFVDYSGRCGLSDDHLRWCYTATTRAKRRLFAVNAPHITSFDKLTFTAIGKISKAPKDFWPEDDTLATDFHPSTDPIGVRLKLRGIEQALTQTDFRLNNVEKFNYLDKFHFVSSTGEQVRIDAYYDGAGFFKLLPISGDGSSRDMLCQLINNSIAEHCGFRYEPGNGMMRELFQRVTTAAVDAEVKIVNVIEVPQQYYVNYYLVTDARFAVIQFYYKANGLTSALPKSETGPADGKLARLIQLIENNN